MHTSVEREIREFVVENFLFGQDDELRDENSFLESGIIDSTGVLELVGFLEKRFTISIQDNELIPENLDSIERATEFVRRKLGAKGERVAG